uniref:NAD(P)H-quinone oxidoreductase subunit 4L n=1 Tax=Pabstiella mirabilis TaxID=125501 RepID=A0A8F9RQN2_9ASPA|nr:NAD(P)H-quinone oxidoreductase subunit 4L [Pabstiella mirabilis]
MMLEHELFQSVLFIYFLLVSMD